MEILKWYDYADFCLAISGITSECNNHKAQCLLLALLFEFKPHMNWSTVITRVTLHYFAETII